MNSYYGAIFSLQSLQQLIRVFPFESLIMLLVCLNIFVPNIISYRYLSYYYILATHSVQPQKILSKTKENRDIVLESNY